MYSSLFRIVITKAFLGPYITKSFRSIGLKRHKSVRCTPKKDITLNSKKPERNMALEQEKETLGL